MSDASNSDAAATLRACPADPTLALCLSFDAPTLPNPIPNEGALAVDASHTNVVRVPYAAGGAALLDANSTIAFPAHPAVTGLVAFDATVRFDAEIAAGERVGVIDTDASSPGASMFVFGGTTTTHRVRCSIGGAEVFGETSIPPGTFTTLTCTCENNTMRVGRDGIELASGAGCSPASGAVNGIQIGQNSRAATMLPPDEPLVGAIDLVRLWTAVPRQ